MVHDLIFELWNYVCDLTFFLASAIILFSYFHKRAGKESYRTGEVVVSTSEAISTTKKTPDSGDLISITLDNNINNLSNVSAGDEIQSSFLMVSSPSLEIHASHDVRLIKKFDRLKTRSWRTIQTLTENRQRLTFKAAAGFRKERAKRPHASHAVDDAVLNHASILPS